MFSAACTPIKLKSVKKAKSKYPKHVQTCWCTFFQLASFSSKCPNTMFQPSKHTKTKSISRPIYKNTQSKYENWDITVSHNVLKVNVPNTETVFPPNTVQ